MQTCYVRIAMAMAAQATLCALSFAVPEVARLFSAAAAAFQGLALVSLLRVFVSDAPPARAERGSPIPTPCAREN